MVARRLQHEEQQKEKKRSKHGRLPNERKGKKEYSSDRKKADRGGRNQPLLEAPVSAAPQSTDAAAGVKATPSGGGGRWVHISN